MKILLLSDTHSDLTKASNVFQKLTNIDLILHCGDYQHDAYHLEDMLGVPVISVKGNSDGCHKPDRQKVETPAGKILITHGHMEGVSFDYTRLLYLAEEEDCIAVCFGHTHKAFCENFDGIWLINPGSLTEPRDGSGGTYAILRAEEDDFYANIVQYDKIFTSDKGGGSGSSGSGTNTKPKVTGGFLRGLLNYSDRF